MIQVSIIIVVYNAGEYLEKCLSSVFCQTYKGDIECILVNDCSTDDSLQIASNLINAYNGDIKFRIINHKSNKGAAAARNTGIDAAIGTWIYFLDQDDWILPQCIELMVASTTKYPQTQVVFAGANATSDHYYSWLDYENKDLPEYSDNQAWLQASMLRRIEFGMTAWNKLILRDFVQSNNLYFVEGLVHEDEGWNFDIAKHIQSASFVLKNTYTYNIHSGSIIRKATADERVEWLFKTWNILIERISNDNKKLKKMQVRGICKYMYDVAPKNLSLQKRFRLSSFYLKLSVKSCDIFSLRLFHYSLKALM